MKKLIVWTMSLVFALTVSLAFAADPVKKEEKQSLQLGYGLDLFIFEKIDEGDCPCL